MSSVYMSTNDVLETSKKFAKNLNKYGFNVAPEDIVGCEFLENTRKIGHTEVLGEHKFYLHLNKELCKTTKTEFIKNVIYHELAHMVQYNEAFAQKVIIRNEEFGNTEPLPGKEAIAHGAVYDNYGHTAYWRDIVKDIQERVQFKIPITAYADKITVDKMLEELFVREAETYINEKGNLVHVDYVISGFTMTDVEKYSDKVPVRIEDLREALAKVDFSDVRPITPPDYKGPNATRYYIEKYIDENGNWREPNDED